MSELIMGVHYNYFTDYHLILIKCENLNRVIIKNKFWFLLISI